MSALHAPSHFRNLQAQLLANQRTCSSLKLRSAASAIPAGQTPRLRPLNALSHSACYKRSSCSCSKTNPPAAA
jgi:hypothetical protein